MYREADKVPKQPAQVQAKGDYDSIKWDDC